ncbi:MAG: ABC transporter ATP-binding protein, partial [Myxococcales bacterium]|nr:ABC transporter ATP-binding protein [Myxococcales bacterium]
TVYVTHDQVEAMTLADRIALMNKGVLQQMGTAHELYEWPNHKYVASFLGSPGMNFLTVTARDGRLEAPGLDVPSPLELPNGTSVVLGLRPHALFANAQQAGDKYGTVDTVLRVAEPLGWETHLHVTVGSERDPSGNTPGWVVRAESSQVRDLKAGDAVRLYASIKEVRLFDLDTGAALLSQPASDE